MSTEADERFTDGKRRIATVRDLDTKWNGRPPGHDFRCYLCGHKFKVGEGWRWQYGSGRTFRTDDDRKFGVCNFLVCDSCDGPDVLDRWVALHTEFYQPKFWHLRGTEY